MNTVLRLRLWRGQLERDCLFRLGLGQIVPVKAELQAKPHQRTVHRPNGVPLVDYGYLRTLFLIHS